MQTSSAWSIAEIEIKDMSDEQAPIALEWTFNADGLFIDNIPRNSKIRPIPSASGMHVRKSGSNFYRPVLRLEQDNRIAPINFRTDVEFLRASNLEAMLAELNDTMIFSDGGPNDAAKRRLKKNGGQAESEFDSVDWNDLPETAAAIEKAAWERYVIVDDIVYERCQEPTISLHHAQVVTGENEVPIEACVLSISTDTHMTAVIASGHDYYSTAIENGEKALSQARQRNRKVIDPAVRVLLDRINTQNIPRDFPLEASYHPENVWRLQLARKLTEITGVIGRTNASELTDEWFSAYKRISRCMGDLESEESLEEIGNALADLHEFFDEDAEVKSVNEADEALEILDNRPMVMRAGEPATPKSVF